MPYLDITPDANNWRTKDGDFLLTNRDVDIAADVLLSNLGDFKYAPLVAGRAPLYLNSTSQAEVIARNFKVALKSAGFTNPVIDVSNFPQSIEVNNDEVLL